MQLVETFISLWELYYVCIYFIRINYGCRNRRLVNLRFADPRALSIRDLTILGRQRDGDGQNKLLQINGSKDSSSYIINRMNLIQF
jgi:hypothetical protein